jgi:hypothetical protein
LEQLVAELNRAAGIDHPVAVQQKSFRLRVLEHEAATVVK